MMENQQSKSTVYNLSLEEKLECEAWKSEQKKKSNTGATIGGRWTYEFTPTGLGTIKKVKDNETGDILDLTDISNW